MKDFTRLDETTLARSERLDNESHPADVGLVSVNTGIPRIIGTTRFGHPIRSGIVKAPVGDGPLQLTALNLGNDRQADLKVHGGPDKAVYAYPSEHLPRWNDELGTTFGIGTFGENLTTAGWLEEEVRIGDIWSWGDAVLQVTQPRSPCYKLAAVTVRSDLLKRLIRSGRTGWYLRVLQPGLVPVVGPVAVVVQDPAEVTVLQAHRAVMVNHGDREELERVGSVTSLADAWREAVHDRLERMANRVRPISDPG